MPGYNLFDARQGRAKQENNVDHGLAGGWKGYHHDCFFMFGDEGLEVGG